VAVLEDEFTACRRRAVEAFVDDARNASVLWRLESRRLSVTIMPAGSSSCAMTPIYKEVSE